MDARADFSPPRLRIARQLNGLKQVALAAEVELSPAALSQYEHGVHAPSPPALQRLAFALGFPAAFFHGDGTEPVAAPAFFRSLRATPQSERDRAAAFAWLVARLATAVEERVRLPHCDLRLDRNVSSNATRDDIEEAATAARAAWDVPGGPIANVVRLLESLGAVVSYFHAGDTRLSAFSQWHAERPVVVLCSDKWDKARSRYDAAHELAHLALHGEPEPGNNILEQQADEFASALLMPADDIRRHLPHGRVDWQQLFELKRTWGVSAQALLVRAHRLGTIGERAYRNAFRYLSQQGWRRVEPVDLGPPEQPLLLKRAVELLRDRGQAGALLRSLNFPEPVLTEIVGDVLAGSESAAVVEFATHTAR